LVAACALEGLFSRGAEDILDSLESAAVFRMTGCLNRWNAEERSIGDEPQVMATRKERAKGSIVSD